MCACRRLRCCPLVLWRLADFYGRLVAGRDALPPPRHRSRRGPSRHPRSTFDRRACGCRRPPRTVVSARSARASRLSEGTPIDVAIDAGSGPLEHLHEGGDANEGFGNGRCRVHVISLSLCRRKIGPSLRTDKYSRRSRAKNFALARPGSGTCRCKRARGSCSRGIGECRASRAFLPPRRHPGALYAHRVLTPYGRKSPRTLGKVVAEEGLEPPTRGL